MQNAALGHQFQDANRINYFTPRIMGLQVGAGYAPKMNLAPGPALLAPGSAPGRATMRRASAASTTRRRRATARRTTIPGRTWFDISANYLNKFGEVVVALYGGFMYAQFIPGFTSGVSVNPGATGANLTSWKQWAAGAEFGDGGFTLGGSIGYDNNGLAATGTPELTTTAASTRWAWMYETGAWQMSFGWAGTPMPPATVCRTDGSCRRHDPGTHAMPVGGTSAIAFGNQLAAGGLTFGSPRFKSSKSA